MRESEYLTGNSKIVQKLGSIPTLGNFKTEQLKGMLELSKIRSYEPGELIIEEKKYDSWVYFLVSGNVRVVKEGVQINVLDHPGDVFGEMGIIEGSARSASVCAVSDVVCLAADASYLDRLSDSDKIAFTCILYHLFSELLSSRLRAMDEELVKLKEENERLKKGKTK